jgi:Spy/CpxP family protein refolding chaperone
MKNVMKRVKILEVAGLIVFFFTVCSYAGQDAGCGLGGEMKGERMREMRDMKEKLIADLGLTPEQEKQLEEVKKANREGMEDIFKSLHDKRQELAGELDKYNSDQKTVEALKSDIKGIIGKLVDKKVEDIQGMKKVLNEEQYAKFVQKAKAMREEWKGKKFEPGKGFRRPW